MRVALYMRVSTNDGRQTTENQRRQLIEACESNGWDIVEEYVDNESGRKGDRKAFSQMMKDAGKRRFDVVYFWALDRFSRQGQRMTIDYLRSLEAVDVQFKSHTEPFLDTVTNPLVKSILLNVLAYLAELESKQRSRRTKAGQARARAEGKHIGRRPVAEARVQEWRDLEASGKSRKQIAKEKGVSMVTLRKYLGAKTPK